MSWLSYQRALRQVLLAEDPPAAAIDSLGAEPKRWNAYRRMVRSRFYETIDHGFERLIAVIGADTFHRIVDRFLADSPPRSTYLRDLPGELLRFAERNAASLTRTHGLPPYAIDLMRYEWAELDTAYDHEETRADDVGPFDMQAIAVLTPAHRLLDLDYRVHQVGADGQDAPSERSPVSLCLYRDRKTHEVETLELSGTAPRILRGMARRAATLADVVQAAAADEGVTIDVAFVEALSTLLADLVERGVLLGSVRPSEK